MAKIDSLTQAFIDEVFGKCCHNCKYNRADLTLPICPKLGESIRYNCAFWRDKNENMERQADES